MKDKLKTKSESCVDGFTVIMPTYNQSGYIRNAIRSLFEQTYTKWELIIVNDGCTDNTEDFIKDYLCEQRVRYYKNDVNQGLGYSINVALNNAEYNILHIFRLMISIFLIICKY